MPQPDPDAWGIAGGHHHVRGDWIPAPPAGVAAALAAMGASDDAPGPTPTWVVRQSDGLHAPVGSQLHTEDGGSEPASGWLPPEALPLGYHRIETAEGDIRLIVSPGQCPVPARMWGWATQLYATRSRASWGMGDLADLRRLCRWSSQASGAGLILVNPVHGVAPNREQQASPYFPASRRWRNPIYLRIEDLPGAAEVDIGDLARAGAALNEERLIDREEVWRLNAPPSS